MHFRGGPHSHRQRYSSGDFGLLTPARNAQRLGPVATIRGAHIDQIRRALFFGHDRSELARTFRQDGRGHELPDWRHEFLATRNWCEHFRDFLELFRWPVFVSEATQEEMPACVTHAPQIDVRLGDRTRAVENLGAALGAGYLTSELFDLRRSRGFDRSLMSEGCFGRMARYAKEDRATLPAPGKGRQRGV